MKIVLSSALDRNVWAYMRSLLELASLARTSVACWLLSVFPSLVAGEPLGTAERTACPTSASTTRTSVGSCWPITVVQQFNDNCYRPPPFASRRMGHPLHDIRECHKIRGAAQADACGSVSFVASRRVPMDRDSILPAGHNLCSPAQGDACGSVSYRDRLLCHLGMLLVGNQAAAQGVFRDAAGVHEVEQVVG